ncbi:MerR family transcriptional regulator [Streptomyces sp. NPDC052052]|uniref:MerR family transcriptional regulator n=1 Tax=Streptomyces sp. NPDC052052 TaxID=3154756 RepID=UPI00343676BB
MSDATAVSGQGPSSAAGRFTAEYRIEDLAHASGTTVRTIRAYQDRGLLPTPERRGRANVYRDTHLARLRQIADLLDRGYTLASIKELLDAWDTGRGLAGVLGLVAEVHGPRADDQGDRTSRAELISKFGDVPDDGAIADVVELGALAPLAGRDDEFLVVDRHELAVAAALHAAYPSPGASPRHLRDVHEHMEQITSSFVQLITEHVFTRCFGNPPATHPDTADTATAVCRPCPLSQQPVDAELTCAIKMLVMRHLLHHDRSDTSALSTESPSMTPTVDIPLRTIQSIQSLVGADNISSFVAAAAEREVQSRTLDALAPSGNETSQVT